MKFIESLKQRVRDFIAGINVQEFSRLREEADRLNHRLDLVRLSLGRIEKRQILGNTAGFRGAEFQVFSQFGEDGLLQYLLEHVNVPSKSFIEFGVEDYTEANTRFLLVNDHWRGLVIDGSAENVRRIKVSIEYHKCQLHALQSFITAENINQIIIDNGFSGPLGILSIDIDGNDYWVWEAINCVEPAIVVCEYNHRYGPTRSVTVPYNPSFDRFKVLSPPLYFGASLKALVRLGKKKGYSLVGCGQNGVNAFFVRHDLLPADWVPLTAEEAFVQGTFSESHRPGEGMEKKSLLEEQELLSKMPLVEVGTDEASTASGPRQ